MHRFAGLCVCVCVYRGVREYVRDEGQLTSTEVKPLSLFAEAECELFFSLLNATNRDSLTIDNNLNLSD